MKSGLVLRFVHLPALLYHSSASAAFVTVLCALLRGTGAIPSAQMSRLFFNPLMTAQHWADAYYFLQKYLKNVLLAERLFFKDLRSHLATR